MKDGLGEKVISRRKFLEYFGLGAMSIGLTACAPEKAFKKMTEVTAEVNKDNFVKVAYGEGKSCFEAASEAVAKKIGSENEHPFSINNATSENPQTKYMFVKKEGDKIAGVYLFNNHDNLYNFLSDGKMETTVEDEMKNKFGETGEVLAATGNVTEFSGEMAKIKEYWKNNPETEVLMVFTGAETKMNEQGLPVTKDDVTSRLNGEEVFLKLGIE
jgi:hypothetical protein